MKQRRRTLILFTLHVTLSGVKKLRQLAFGAQICLEELKGIGLDIQENSLFRPREPVDVLVTRQVND